MIFGVRCGSYNILKRLENNYGAEGEIQKNANKVNELGVVGVQNREKRVLSRTLYAPKFRHSKRAGLFLALFLLTWKKHP